MTADGVVPVSGTERDEIWRCPVCERFIDAEAEAPRPTCAVCAQLRGMPVLMVRSSEAELEAADE